MNLHRWIAVCLSAMACCAEDTSARDAPSAFRSGTITIPLAPPAADAPIDVMLPAGKPFELAGRYAYAKNPGVAPDVSASTIEGGLPDIHFGDVIGVRRSGATARVRIVGMTPTGEVIVVPQASPPFLPAFAAVPWSAWGGQAAAVHACANAVAIEATPCLAATGDPTWCAAAASAELDACAATEDFAVAPAYGGTFHPELECLLPAPYYETAMGTDMSMGDCAGSFWGTIAQVPGDGGCVPQYDGTWVADDPDCMDGPGDTIVLGDVLGR